MNRSIVRLVASTILSGAAACGGGASDPATGEDDLVSESARTEADFSGVDCLSSCPSAGVSGGLVGPISGKRVVSASFTQLATCAADHPSPPEGLHGKRAGEPCFLSRSPSHGQPVDGASVCEAFACGETGTFRASACIAPAIASAAEYRSPPGKCATKAEACAAAREIAARAEQPLCL